VPAAQGHPDLGCILTSFAGRDSTVVSSYVDTFVGRSRRRGVIVGFLGAREETSDMPAGSLRTPAKNFPAFNGSPIPYAGRPGLWELNDCRLVDR
jgi:hypothetical protein